MPIWGILAAIFSVAAGAVSYISARKAQKAAKKPNDEQRGVLVNKESNIEQIPVIYGERRVGGVRVFVSTDGTSTTGGGWKTGYHPDTDTYDTTTSTPTNEYLYIALVLCEGEVESITDIYVDDVPITDDKYTGLINYDAYLGTDTQTMPDTHYLRQVNEYWTADHRLRGVAFLGMRFKWDEEAFSGIPEITALVKGRKIYDPRTSTTAWSDNPALCIRDYLTNTRYGKGLPSSAIDDTLIGDAADDCDQSVTLYDGGGSGKTFTCNVVLDTSKTLFDNLNTLLLGCRGFLPYTQGEYRLKIDGSSSSIMTFTTDTIIGGIQIKGESKDEKFNRVTVKFPNPDANWQPDTAIWPPAGSTEETTYLAEDGGVLLHEEIELDTITNYYQARDLARVILLRSRNALICAIKTTSEALQLEIADVVSITHATPGWTAKPFQVMGMQLNDDGTVDLALLEYDSTIYTWEVGTEQQTYPDTSLPDPFTVASISNITVTETTTLGSDGTVIPTGLIEWDASYDNLVNQYEIQYKLTSEADTEFKSIFTSVPKYEFYNAEVGISVTIRIRAINSLNVKGAFTTATFTVNGDTTAPGIATSVTAAAGYRYNTVSWTNPTDKDFAKVEVYAGNTSGSGSATLIGEIAGDTFVEGGLSESQTRYYYLKTVDFSGNKSAFSAGASATTLADPTDGEDGATGTRSASGYVYYAFATVSAPASPTLSGFNFVTGQFSTISSGWSTAVSVPAPEEGKSFWAVRYAVSESTFGGAQTITKSAVFAWQNFDGLVTFTNLQDGIDDNVTSIDGGKISTTSLSAINADLGTITAGVINTAGGSTKLSLGADGAANSAVYITRTSTSSGDGVMMFLDDSTSASGYYRAFFNSDEGDTIKVVGNGGGSYVVIIEADSASGSIANIFDVRGYGDIGGQFTNRKDSGSGTSRNPALRAQSIISGTTESKIDLSTADGYAAYVHTGTTGPFTAAHDSLISKIESFVQGDIVIDTSVANKRGISDVICYGTKSTVPDQKGVIGVYNSRKSLDLDNPPAGLVTHYEAVANPNDPETPITERAVTIPEASTIAETHDVAMVNSIGEGQINVCGEGGNIEVGDLIVTSSTAGKGMKQIDDIIRSYTVAKARESVTFSAGEIKQIACIYLCG